MILCTTCGTQNEDGTSFCTACNGYLAWVGKPVADAPEAPAAEPTPAERPRVNTVELGRSPAAEPAPPPPSPAAPTAAPRSPLDPGAIDAVVPVAGATTPRRVERPRTQAPVDALAGAVPPGSAPAAPAAPAGPAAAAPGAPPAAAAGAVAGPEVTCASCGTANPADRRFCRRCGAALRDLAPVPEALPAVPVAAAGKPRRFRLGRLRDDDVRRQGRMAYNAAIGLRARVLRVLLFLGAFGFGVAMVPPWGGDVRGWGMDQLDRFRPASYLPLPVRSVALQGGTELEGFNSAFATDAQATRAWATVWNPAAPPLADDAPCPATGAATSSLVLTFAKPVQIDRLTVRAGLDRATSPRWAEQARPRLLDLVFSDGTCQRITLNDIDQPQRKGLKAREVTGVEVRIVDVFPATTGSGDRAAISELTFEAER